MAAPPHPIHPILVPRSPDEMFVQGLMVVGFDIERQESVRLKKNLQRFSTHFKCKPIVLAQLWEDLQTTSVDEARIEPTQQKDVDYYLMAIHFLACYPKENEAEGQLKVSDRTWRYWVWFYLKRIRRLKQTKIVWPIDWRRPGSNQETIFIISVDGTHCRIHEPKHGRYSKNPKYYSHKFQTAGLSYEIALSIWEERCVWTSKRYRAGRNDKSIFNAKLKGMIPPGKLVIADKGYPGSKTILSLQSSHDTDEVREFKSRVLARQEKFNGLLKEFACLHEVFRHGEKKHQICFTCVVILCQYRLENGTLLFLV